MEDNIKMDLNVMGLCGSRSCDAG